MKAIVAGIPWPELSPRRMRACVDDLASSLSNSLSRRQRRYLQKFKPTGGSLKAVFARALVRFFVTRVHTGSDVLDISESGRSFFTDTPWHNIGFSYSSMAAFALMTQTEARIAIDAEIPSDLNINNELGRIFPFFTSAKKIPLVCRHGYYTKIWLILETLIKIYGLNQGMPFLRAILNANGQPLRGGCFSLAGNPFSWRIFALHGHQVCVGVNRATRIEVHPLWLHPWPLLEEAQDFNLTWRQLLSQWQNV